MADQNNTDSRTQVQTRGFRTSNGAAIVATAFAWDFQDDMLKLTTTPELPSGEQTEKRRYDYQNSWVTCVTRPKCLDLWDEFNKLIIPAMEKKEEKNISVPVGGVNQFGIGVRPNDKGEMEGYVKLIKNIDPQSLQTTETIEYVFRKGEVIEDYDPSTGKFGGRIITDNEFLLFINDLKCFVDASSKAWNHANRVVDKTYKDMIATDIRSIGNKVGAEMSTPYAAQRAGARNGQPSLFDTNSMNAPADTITSLDELNIPTE